MPFLIMRKVKYLMKILKVSIYSPDKKLLREVNFKENGLSVIYGDVEKPKSESETSNSIGKTILLKIINVVYGAKNSGKDTIKGLDKYIVNATVKNPLRRNREEMAEMTAPKIRPMTMGISGAKSRVKIIITHMPGVACTALPYTIQAGSIMPTPKATSPP